MSSYLYNKFKNKYRIIADYDMDTMDFPRDSVGNIDKSFDDYYIPCRKNVEIRHAYRDTITCFVWSLGTGNNIVRAIYQLECGKSEQHNNDWYYEQLKNQNIFTDYVICDKEISFTFKADYLPKWEGILKPKTFGKGIRPLSPKNLPKSDYKIPEDDIAAYKAITDRIIDPANPLNNISIINKANNSFKKTLPKKADTERKKLCMKWQQYIHYSGKWNKYLKFMEKTINEKTERA